MIQLFFCLRGNENIDQLKMSNIQRVDSEDLEYSYYRLVQRLPDKNHKIDIELEGAGKIHFLSHVFLGFLKIVQLTNIN